MRGCFVLLIESPVNNLTLNTNNTGSYQKYISFPATGTAAYISSLPKDKQEEMMDKAELSSFSYQEQPLISTGIYNINLENQASSNNFLPNIKTQTIGTYQRGERTIDKEGAQVETDGSKDVITGKEVKNWFGTDNNEYIMFGPYGTGTNTFNCGNNFNTGYEMEAQGIAYTSSPTTAEKDRLMNVMQSSEYMQDKDFTKEEISVFIEKIGRIEGAEKNMELLSANNENLNKGRYAELVRTYFLEKEGYKVDSIGKIVETPLGKTDIDILLENGTWIENKQVQDICADQKFKEKIDKMASAVETGMEVNGIKIKRAIFINRGKINKSAIEYAISKGIPIFRDLQYDDAPKILSILSFYKDMIELDPEVAVQCAEGAYKSLLPSEEPLQLTTA